MPTQAGGSPADAGPQVDTGIDAGPVDMGICLDEGVASDLREGALPAELALGVRAFPQAICSCSDVVGRAAFATEAWGGGAGGDVALNSHLNLQADSAVAGSLIVAGPTGISLSTAFELEVGGSLEANGPLRGVEAAVSVGGNASVGADIVLMDLRVSGTLTQPAGVELTVSGTSDLGAQQSGDVSVSAPCPCADNDLLDVAALVQAALPTTEPAMPQACPWPAQGSGPRALFVPGDLAVDGDLAIGNGPGEDIALIVEGNVNVPGRIELGSVEHQRRVHLYVGGNGTVQLSSGGTLVGAVYAPKAELVSGELSVYGALFVARVNAEGGLAIHHDPALQ